MSTPNPSSNLARAQQGATQRYKQKKAAMDLARILMQKQELSQRQLNAIELLLRGLSDAQVGQQIGVDRGTIFRWRKDETFATELEKQRRFLTQQSAGRLQSMLEPALDILQKQISGDDPKTALRAAAILLRVATPARLERLSNPPPPEQDDSSEGDAIDVMIDRYINAPMPGQPGHPVYERDMKRKRELEAKKPQGLNPDDQSRMTNQ